MRTGKQLLHATREFAHENLLRSWIELVFTLLLAGTFVAATSMERIPVQFRILTSLATGLMYVRLFVIYHDYQHNAILQGSRSARWIMKSIGIFLLAPQTIWKRSHDHHHNNNSKLVISAIGSYPTITKKKFLSLTKGRQRIYLMNRHPLTVIFGYLTLFIYWLNLRSFVQSPQKHIDSLCALLLHFAGAVTVFYYLGLSSFVLIWFTPFFVAFGTGSYLFYCQHNFPGAQFRENHDWKYDRAAITSTSLMVMPPLMRWVTGNIGYHHVHHLNSRIPFYRLREAMAGMPELQHVTTTSWNPFEMARCFSLKFWDPERGKMITLRELYVDLES